MSVLLLFRCDYGKSFDSLVLVLELDLELGLVEFEDLMWGVRSLMAERQESGFIHPVACVDPELRVLFNLCFVLFVY